MSNGPLCADCLHGQLLHDAKVCWLCVSVTEQDRHVFRPLPTKE